MRRFALACLLLAALGARAELGGEVRLLTNPEAPREQWRRVPLPNVYVIVTWNLVIPSIGHPIESCRLTELTRTDADGRYVLEGPSRFTTALAETHYSAYARGLEWAPYSASPDTGPHITLVRSTRTPEQRISNLAGLTYAKCSDRELHDPKGLAAPFYRAVLDEARDLKVESQVGRNHLSVIEAAARGPAREVPEKQRRVVIDSPRMESQPAPPGKVP